MTNDILLSIIASGLIMGGIFALVATGLTVVFGVTKIVNFAHGEFLMLGMYFVLYMHRITLISPYLCVLVAVPVFFLLGALYYKFVLGLVMHRDSEVHILTTLGTSIVLQSLALACFDPDVQTLPGSLALAPISIGKVRLSSERIMAFVAALAILGLMTLLLSRTRLGKVVRACADNSDLATAAGISTKLISMIVFGIGASMAAFAGGMILPFFPVSPYVGFSFTITCFVIVVLGGLGNLRGALIAALLIGLIESATEFFWIASLKQVVTFGLFALTLLFRPSGLFGRSKEWMTV